MPDLVGAAIPTLEHAMRFRVARQGLLAANLANVDTPGYRRRDLRFQAELQKADSGLARTHARHLAGERAAAGGHRLETGRQGTRPDRNGVDLLSEVVAATRNAGAFKQQAAVMSRLLAIQRVAVTGEAR